LRQLPLAIFIAAVASVVASCGSEEIAEADYFPLATGNVWEYVETYDDTTKPAENTRHEVSGLETIQDFDGNDVEVWVIANHPNVETDEVRVYYTADDGTVLRRIRQTVDGDGDGSIDKQQDYVPGITKMDRAHLNTGDKWNDSLMRHTTYPSDSTAQQSSSQVLYESTVVSIRETVTVPAGTFDNCIKVERVNVADGADQETKIYWFAPGVGKIKEQTVGDLDTGKVEELTAYSVDVQD